MWILEIYQSKQGEGLWTGNYSIFVRTLGCPLRCRYCDTPYARSLGFDEEDGYGADLSAEEIVGRVLLLDLPHVVITGGEPMLSPEIEKLTRLLKDFDYLITIETAGIANAAVECDLMSISPKLSNSRPPDSNDLNFQRHEQERFRPDIVQKLISRYNYQLKFVVDTPDDLEEIENYLTRFDNIIPERILLMPQAIDVTTMTQKADWILPFCESHGFRYCPRMQIVWYGNKRRT